MKKRLQVVLLILAINLSVFHPVHAITKNEIKQNLKRFFETDEARITREKEEKAKQLYDIYFSEMETRFTKWQEYKDADTPSLQAEYAKYLNNKNNMEHNRYLCDMLDTWEKQYNEIIRNIDYEYKQAYQKMNGRDASNEEFERFKKNNQNLEGFKFSEIVKSKLKNIEKINEEVSDYSYAYEQKKLQILWQRTKERSYVDKLLILSICQPQETHK